MARRKKTQHNIIKDMAKETDYNKLIQERFAELPKAVQDAVTDASVQQKLRALAAKHKLHLDQWVLLEDQIMLTLLGIEEPEKMVQNVAREVGTTTEIAQKIVNDIALEVFKPIREQMQGALDHGQNDRKSTATQQTNAPDATLQAKVAPTDTLAYKPGESSAQRRDVQEDPYRESTE